MIRKPRDYSPPLAMQYVKHLTDQILKFERQRIDTIEFKAIDDNNQLTGLHGFSYGGRIYTHMPPDVARLKSFKPPHPSLVPELEKARKDANVLATDHKRITQVLTLLLKPCQTVQDIRDALPDTLVKLVGDSWVKLPRTRSHAWTLADTPLLYEQYMRQRECYEYYLVSNLLY